MKTHTTEFKNQLRNMGRQIDSTITYGNTTLREELYQVTPHYEASLLKSVMKQLDIESSVSIPVGTVVNCKIGIKVSDSFEYLDYGNYVVYSIEKIEDTGTYKMICYDKMLYSMKEYENLGVTYPITIRNYINALCTKIGLTFKDINTQFTNYDKQIPAELYLDGEGNSMGYTFRDVLDELAQVTASIICIDEATDKLQIKYLNETNDTINEEFLKNVNVKFGEKYGPVNTIVLSRSAGADNIYYPSTLPADPCAIKISDNQIMNGNDRDTYMPAIYNKLNGLEFFRNDFSSIGILYYDLGDMYNIEVGSTTYNCIMLNDEINVTQGIEEIIHTDLLEESETDYEKSDSTDRRINQTYLIVDKQNQIIQSVVTNVTEQNTKIAAINQTVNELNSKIQDIADITTQAETIYASLSFTDINQSEPIEVKIHPTITNISYLYPTNVLYPSDTLYITDRTLRFTNTSTSEVFDYELPDDLLVETTSGTYDEFYLGYDNQVCQIIKRCTRQKSPNMFNPKYRKENNTIYCYHGTATERGGAYTITPTSQSYIDLWKYSSNTNVYYDEDFGPLFEFEEDNYSISFTSSRSGQIYVTYFDANKKVLGSTHSTTGNEYTVNKNNLSSTATYFSVCIEFTSSSSTSNFTCSIMVNEGTTALPYELYDSFKVVVLPSEQTFTYTYPSILLTDGNYTVELLGYNDGYMSIRLMSQNIYTTQFATKAELNSEISQTAASINAEVVKKVGEDEIIAKINLSPEEIKINANKLSFSGKTIDLTADDIVINSTNFNVDKNGNVVCQNADIKGTIRNYNSLTGYLAVEIRNNAVNFYDFQNDGSKNGSLVSTYTQNTGTSGIALYVLQNKRITIGYKSNDSDNGIVTLFDYSSANSNALPYIRNTVNGTLFSSLSGGGIQVESGLIKNWNMAGAWSGSFYVSVNSVTYKITVSQGLITGVEQT